MIQIARILETCTYVIRQTALETEVLMLHRHVEPNKNRWVPIGGLIEFTESPLECALRELLVTGLTATKAIFRGLITEISPFEDKQWFLFVYMVTDFTGEVKYEIDKGHLQWFRLSEIASLSKPQSDTIFGPRVLDLKSPFYEATMYFDEDIKLTRVQET
jgi:8-oxo-dGTP diphosphatase